MEAPPASFGQVSIPVERSCVIGIVEWYGLWLEPRAESPERDIVGIFDFVRFKVYVGEGRW